MDTVIIDLSNGITKQDCNSIVDELTYRNYRWNRLQNPDITPEQWSTILNNVEVMELRFQSEVK